MEASLAGAVEQAMEGDPEAFRLLVERHSRTVYRLAYRVTGNAHDAEEAVQETFLKAYRRLGGFESRSQFATWLTRIAVNCAVDVVRARQRHEKRREPLGFEESEGVMSFPAEGPSPEREAFGREVRNRLNEALAELSPAERAAFVLRHYEGHSIEEIRRSLGLSAQAAKNAIFRAVRKLRRALLPLVNSGEGTP